MNYCLLISLFLLTTNSILYAAEPIRFGIMSLAQPARIHKQWQPFVDYVSKKSGYKIYYTRDEFSFAKEDFKADFKVDLNAKNDWLKFDVDCYCGQDKFTLKDLQDYINNKKDFIKMKDGTFLKVKNREELERFVMMLESFHAREQGGFEGKLYHALELENIFTSSKYYNAKVKESFNKFIKEAKKIGRASCRERV